MRLAGFPLQTVPAVAVCGLLGFGFGKLVNTDEVPPSRSASESSRSIRPAASARSTPMEDFQSLLAPLSQETDIWKVISRIPPDQIQQAIREVEKQREQGTFLPREREILSALYFHWAESDPKAALAGVSPEPESPERTDLVKSVLAAWTRSDPDEAYRGVMNHKDFEYYGRTMLVQTWTAENVFENLERHPDKHRDLIGWYCASLAKKPEARDAMLKALQENPQMKNGDWARFLLFRSWGYKDFDEAIAKAEELKSQNMVNLLVKDNASQPFGAPKVFKWAARNHIPPGGPDWEKGYHEWLGYDGENARAWLAEQAPVWENEGHLAAAASFLAQDYSNALDMKFNSERESARKRLQDLLDRWKTKDPQAAAKWLDTAPDSARKMLGGNGGNE
jgi:hypothetical protein